MTEWLQPIGQALPIVLALVLVIWMAIVYHGDSRWLKRPEAMDNDGRPKWATKETVDTMSALILGQNDGIAAHENRLGRLEDREEIVLKDIRTRLTSLDEKMDDVGTRVIRLEERTKDRRRTDLEG